MKDSCSVTRRGISTLAVLFFLFPSMAAYDSASGQHSGEPPESYKTYAKTEPISNRRLTFQLQFEGGQVAYVTQLEGALIRVESTKDETIMGLTPLFSDDGNVQIKLFKIEQIKHQDSVIGESLSEIENLAIHGDETRISNGGFSTLETKFLVFLQ